MEKVVYSLVANSGINDSRVIKQAKVISRAGYNVYLFCNNGGNPGIKSAKDVLSNEDKTSREPVSVVGFNSYKLSEINEDKLQVFNDFSASGDVLFKKISGLIEYRNRLDEITADRDKSKSIYLGMVENNKKRGLLKKLFRTGRSRSALDMHRDKYLKAHDELRRFTTDVYLKSHQKELMYFSRYALYAINLIDIVENEQIQPPAVIHAHDLYTLPAAVILAKRFGSSVIYDAHEIELERIPPLPNEKKEFIYKLETDCLRFTNEVITVSESCANFLREKYHINNVSVVMNSPDYSNISKVNDHSFRSVDNLSKPFGEEIKIIYTGAVGGEYRGLDKVVEALRLLKAKAHLFILGPRHKVHDLWLTEIVEKHDCSDYVHLLPPVHPEKVVDVIQQYDIAICPIQDASLSYRYSLPNKLLEAAAAKLPICVSDLPEMANFVSELGIGEIMDQTSPRSIASAIQKIVDNPNSYHYSCSALETIKDKYSWERQAIKLKKIYSSV